MATWRSALLMRLWAVSAVTAHAAVMTVITLLFGIVKEVPFGVQVTVDGPGKLPRAAEMTGFGFVINRADNEGGAVLSPSEKMRKHHVTHRVIQIYD